jgi:hypothetical protein
VFDGGLGAVAKLAEGPTPEAQADATRRVPAEVAAWLLACELGWPDLVPTTTLGVVRSIFTRNYVAASVQVAWPLFRVAGETAATVASCPDQDQWRVAIFDALAGNTDRNATNWGFIGGVDRPKLIDHGHAFDSATPTTSEFSSNRRGQTIPHEHLQRVQKLLVNAGASQLPDVLETATVDAIFVRAQTLVDTTRLDF